jgi:hypothetical protein
LASTAANRAYAAASQLPLYDRLDRAMLSSGLRVPGFCVDGIAGCAKSTVYLYLAALLRLLIIVPTNELRDDLILRAAELQVALDVVTQHRALELRNIRDYDLVIIDEAYQLPEHHVFALCALHDFVVPVGDYHQITDLGFGSTTVATFSPTGHVFRLTHSFTIPEDVLAFCIESGLCPPDCTTSNRAHAFDVYRDGVAADCVICASRDCAKNRNHRTLGTNDSRTIFTAQGQRWKTIIFHMCKRDSEAIESSSTFQSRRLLFTALTRATVTIYLDFSSSAFEQIAPSFQRFNPDRSSLLQNSELPSAAPARHIPSSTNRWYCSGSVFSRQCPDRICTAVPRCVHGFMSSVKKTRPKGF